MVVAVFATHDQAEAAVRRLQEAGTATDAISILGYGQHDGAGTVGHYSRGGEVRHVGEHRGLWSFLSGLLSDTGTFVIPGSGPVMVAGPAVGWVAEALENAEGNDDAMTRGLERAGVPHDDVPRYVTALQDGGYLAIVHGAAEAVSQAHALLDGAGASDSAVYPR